MLGRITYKYYFACFAVIYVHNIEHFVLFCLSLSLALSSLSSFFFSISMFYVDRIVFLKCFTTIYITRDLLRLNVGRNSLSEIPKGSLEILKNLNHLDLSFNKIRDVKEKNFEGEEFVF